MTLQMAPLGSVIQEAKPGFASGDDLKEGIFQIRMNNITRDGSLDLTKKRRVRVDGKKADGLFVEVGDVLFNATNSPELVGKSAHIGSLSEPTTFSNHFIRLRTTPEKLDGSYLARWLHTQFQSGRFKGLCRQWVNQATVSRESLLGLEIPLPPLPEQRRIAAILDQADALRAKRREALAQLDSFTQSIFVEMFGDPVKNTKSWAVLPFGKVCETRLGKMLDQKQQTGKHLRKYLRNANVQWFRFDLTDVFEMDFDDDARSIFRLSAGDLLICEGGEPGRAAIWRDEITQCYYQKALHRGRPVADKVTAEYLVWLLWFFAHRGGLGDHVTSATIAHLTGEKLKAMSIPVPPIALQNEFAELLMLVDKIKSRLTESLDDFNALFASLQHRVFRGEL